MTHAPRRDAGEAVSAAPWTGGTWLCIALIVVGCSAAFGRTANHGVLHWDDRFHTIENPWFAQINQESFVHFWREQYGNLYIPVAYNVLGAEVWLTQQLTGNTNMERLSPVLLQAVKIALHGLSAIMLFLLARRLVRSDSAACAAALFFALHPLQTESVAWISETRGLLGSVFGLASILALEKACGAAPRSTGLPTVSASFTDFATRASWWFIGAVLLAAALLSKPATVTIPLIAAAILWAKHVPLRRIAIGVVPLLGLSIAAVVVTRAVQSAEVIVDSPLWWQRPLIAADALCFYTSKLVWPVWLAPDYGRTPQHVLLAWGGWWAWVALAMVISGSVSIIFLARRSRPALAAAAITLLALLPVLGLSTFHHQAISTVADRYAYLAMLGPAILVAWWLAGVRGRRTWCAAGVVLVACAALSFRQAAHWHDDETLWRHAITVNPASPVAHNNLGRELQRQGLVAGAEPHLLRAAELDPTSANILVNIGELRSSQNRQLEAETFYRRAIDMSPRDVRGLIDLGIVLAETGRNAEAAEVLRRALAIDPDQAEGQVNLAALEMQAGKLDSAVAMLEEVLRKRPLHPQALYNLALVRASQGRWKEAAELWGGSIGAGIRTLEVYLRRGDAFIRAEMYEEAEFAHQEAVGAHPKAYEPWNNLGLLYIRQNRVEQAITAFERAAAIAPEASEPRDNLDSARKLLERSK